MVSFELILNLFIYWKLFVFFKLILLKNEVYISLLPKLILIEYLEISNISTFFFIF